MRRALPSSLWRLALTGGVTALASTPLLAGPATAAGPPVLPVVQPQPFASAAGGQSLPDDVTVLGNDVFATFQNGVGPDGAPAPSGVADSSVVEYGPGGTTARPGRSPGG